MLAGYSALNFGHRHPRLVAAATRQLGRVTLVSPGVRPRPVRAVLRRARRAVRHGDGAADEHRRRGGRDRDQGRAQVGVRDARRPARRGGHRRVRRELPRADDDDRVVLLRPGRAGRLRAVHAGLRVGAVRRPARACGVPSPSTGTASSRCSIEPIQGEAGVVVPPPGFLAGVRSLCTSAGALLIADEIQSGLGRVGATFACALEGVVPDAYLLGKALGGGIVPVSAMVSSRSVLGVLRAGPARVDLRRQPARLRGGPRGDRDAADRGVPGSGRLRSAPCCTRRLGVAAVVGRVVGDRARAVGRGDVRRRWTAGPCASGWPRSACSPRRPTARPIRLAPPLVITRGRAVLGARALQRGGAERLTRLRDRNTRNNTSSVSARADASAHAAP